MKRFITIFILFIIVLCLIYTDAHLVEPNLLITKNEILYLPNWDKNLDGLKIAVVSDLHIGTKTVNIKKLNKIAKRINANNPDLIVFLGDFDSLTIKNAGYSNKTLSDEFKKFKAKYGIYAILGNHDYHTPGEKNIKVFLQKANINILENRASKIIINTRTLNIIGLKDLWYHPNTNPKVIASVVNSPAIVLMHNPDSFSGVPDNIALSLSGHTHGGEIVLPLLGSPIVPSEYGQRYRKGHIVENGKHLYVSGGVATISGFRFLNPPEISILTLKVQTDKTKIKNTKPKKGFTKKHWKACIKYFYILKTNIN